MLNPVINPDFRIVSLQYRERISDHVWQCVRSVQVGWQNSDTDDWVKTWISLIFGDAAQNIVRASARSHKYATFCS